MAGVRAPCSKVCIGPAAGAYFNTRAAGSQHVNGRARRFEEWMKETRPSGAPQLKLFSDGGLREHLWVLPLDGYKKLPSCPEAAVACLDERQLLPKRQSDAWLQARRKEASSMVAEETCSQAGMSHLADPLGGLEELGERRIVPAAPHAMPRPVVLPVGNFPANMQKLGGCRRYITKLNPYGGKVAQKSQETFTKFPCSCSKSSVVKEWDICPCCELLSQNDYVCWGPANKGALAKSSETENETQSAQFQAYGIDSSETAPGEFPRLTSRLPGGH